MGRAFPDRLEIAPFGGPARGRVRPPGSKSITNRALLLAALAEGRSVLTGALMAEDTEAMLGCITGLGATVSTGDSAIIIDGLAGVIPPGRPELFAGQSGTTARFVSAALLLSTDPVTIDADEAMRRRPMGPAIDALRALGAEVVERIDPGRLPFTVRSVAPFDDAMPVLHVPGDLSSQFASGLLIAGACLPQGLRLVVDGALVSRPYLDMTVSVMRRFGAHVEHDDGRIGRWHRFDTAARSSTSNPTPAVPRTSSPRPPSPAERSLSKVSDRVRSRAISVSSTCWLAWGPRSR